MLSLLAKIALAILCLLLTVGPVAFGVAAAIAWAAGERARRRALREVTAEVRDATERNA